jgi:hypothetical protein
MLSTHRIREHMEVIGADGTHVGVVDRMDGKDRIKLTKSDLLAAGSHHYVPVDWVDHIDKHVHLNKDSSELLSYWKAA